MSESYRDHPSRSFLQCKNCAYPFYNEAKPQVSPVTSLLGSNACPAGAEVAAIRSTLQETEGELLAIDNEIELLEAALEQRRRERQALHDYRLAHTALLSPIRQLPPELLTEIFLNCAPSGPLVKWNAYCHEFFVEEWEASLSLSAVCKRWRNVALAAPGLWSTIRVNLRFKVGRGRRLLSAKNNMFQTWIERSGNHPLSITLQAEGINTHPVIDSIINNSYRLRFFDFFVDPISMEALALLRGQLPILQTFICRRGSEYSGFEEDVCGFAADAPQLRILDIGHAPDKLDLPYTQITQFSTFTLVVEECLQALRMAPNVMACNFKQMWGEWSLSHLQPVVSRLHTLTISASPDDDVMALGDFFGLLTLPAIRTISLRLLFLVKWPQTEFMSLISRSSCHLEKLSLNQVAISRGDLLSCLEALPLLRELEIDECDPDWIVPGFPTMHRLPLPADDIVLYRLTNYTKSLPLVPLLHTVFFRGNCNFTDRSVLRMVKSRWCGNLPKGLERIRSVHIFLPRAFEPPTLARGEEWREQGLDITLESTISKLV
jgi:hypothetical protein